MKAKKSKHYNKRRKRRERIIKNRLNGDGEIIDSFVVDRGHKNGAEVHSITNTGLIIITNKDTGILVTKLIARPAQIKRYYNNSNREPPEWLITLAEWHISLGYNR